MADTSTSIFNRIWRGLGSLRLFWWLCLSISSIFYFGVMGIKGGAVHGFKEMNKQILIDWVRGPGIEKPLILGWLFIVALLVMLLSMNLTVRLSSEIKTIHKLHLDWKNKGKKGSGIILLRKASIFLMHFSVVLMILIHLTSSVSGVKLSGPVLSKGHVIKHPLLPFSLECKNIIRPSGKNLGKHARPTVVLKPANSDLPSFKIPGWHQGYYYNIYADYIDVEPESVKPGETPKKPREKIGLKLAVNTLNVVYFLMAAASLCFIGIILHLSVRPEALVFFEKNKKRWQLLTT